MSPRHTNNKNVNKRVGDVRRTAFGTADRRDAGRSENLRVLVRSLVLIACAIGMLVLNVPDLWPHLVPRGANSRMALVASVIPTTDAFASTLNNSRAGFDAASKGHRP